MFIILAIYSLFMIKAFMAIFCISLGFRQFLFLKSAIWLQNIIHYQLYN